MGSFWITFGVVVGVVLLLSLVGGEPLALSCPAPHPVNSLATEQTRSRKG